MWQWRVTNNLIVCGYYFGGWTADGWCVGSYKQIGTFKLQLSKLLPLLDLPRTMGGWGGVESSTSMDGVGFGGWTD